MVLEQFLQSEKGTDQEDDDDGWDYGDDVDSNGEIEQIPVGMQKVPSIIKNEVKSFTLKDLINVQIPA